jgi:DMSO/TMAO reductase YedYZ molybdopterin-dependent catalytic subunit
MSFAGVRFSEFMRRFGLSPARYVALETPRREYYVSIDMDSMRHPQTLLAYEMNGAPLTSEHGAPLRLLIPVKYGIKNLKRIAAIRLSDERPPDYWAERGYDWYAGL